MKTKWNGILHDRRHSLGVAAGAGLFLLIAGAAQAQNIFLSDYGNGALYEYTPTGARTTFALIGTPLNGPEGLAFDSSGNLFVANAFPGNIYKFTPGGVQSTFATGLYYPGTLAFSPTGDLYGDDSHNNIFKFTASGAMSTFIAGLPGPSGITSDKSGNMYVACSTGGTVLKITPNGTQTTILSGLVYPEGLAFNSAGNLFVVTDGPQGNTGNILELTPNGVVSTFAHGLSNPVGLAFDSADNLFLSELGSGTIDKFTPGGSESIFATGLYYNTFIAIQPVPEPSTVWLLAIGAFTLLACHRRNVT